jgi:phage shock protein C
MNDSTLDRLRRRFYLDRRNGWIAGVCAGLAGSLNTDPAFPRVAFVLAGLFMPKLAVAAYLVAWILLDERESAPRSR